MKGMSAPARLLLAAQWRAHRVRLITGLLAIALGVAMGYAVHLIHHTALAEFAHASRVLSGEADLRVQGPQSGFDETLYPRLTSLPQVRAASPVVELQVRPAQSDQTFPLLGVDVFRALAVSPALVGSSPHPQTDRLAHLDPSAIFLSPALLSALGLGPGDQLSLRGGGRTATLRIAGTLPAVAPGQRLGVMDIGAAQWRFDQPGRLQRIDVRLRPGADEAAFRQAAAALLPAGVTIGTPGDQERVMADLSRAYRINLNVLALMALFTGAFLVYSSQSLAVEQRRPQLALLRALGATRGELMRLLMAESLLLGLAGALLGVVLGALLAVAALHWIGTDLGGGFFAGAATLPRFSLPAALGFLALGMAAAGLGGYRPARRAVRTPPALALKAADPTGTATHRPTVWSGLPWILGGLALTQAGPVAGLPLPAYLAIGLLLIGALLYLPWMARTLFGWLPHTRLSVWNLAVTQLTAAPQRAILALAGVLVSFALMAAMLIMIGSFRGSFEQWLDTILPAPLYLRASGIGATGQFPASDRQAILTAPGVATAEFMQTDQLVLDPKLPPVALIIRPIDPHQPGARLAMRQTIPVADSGPPPVWVSEAMADLHGMRTGQVIRIPLDGHWQPFTVAGIWRDFARQYGALVIDAETARRLSVPWRPGEAALWPQPGVTVERLVATLRARLPEGTVYRPTGEIRQASLRIFDRSFAVTYLLEAVAIVVGLFGVGVSFGAQALARSREFGMLRHLGMTRGQIGAILTLEGGLLGALGVLAGLALGWGIALILVKVVNPQSFHWTMEIHMPWASLLATAGTLILAAALTARISGRRALSTDAPRAVRQDW